MNCEYSKAGPLLYGTFLSGCCAPLCYSLVLQTVVLSEKPNGLTLSSNWCMNKRSLLDSAQDSPRNRVAFLLFFRVGHNEIIGVCRVGVNAEGLGRDHWNEMLAYPRKPIAHWHPLVEVKKSFKEVRGQFFPFNACAVHD